MSFASKAGLCVAAALLLFACNDGFRGPRPTGDTSITVDGGDDTAVGDATADTTPGDTSTGDTSTSDTSTPTDGSTPGLGQCDPVCMAMTGAVCCQACGACNTATVMCDPNCGDGLVWDCELLCCFDLGTTSCVGGD